MPVEQVPLALHWAFAVQLVVAGLPAVHWSDLAAGGVGAGAGAGRAGVDARRAGAVGIALRPFVRHVAPTLPAVHLLIAPQAALAPAPEHAAPMLAPDVQTPFVVHCRVRRADRRADVARRALVDRAARRVGAVGRAGRRRCWSRSCRRPPCCRSALLRAGAADDARRAGAGVGARCRCSRRRCSRWRRRSGNGSSSRRWSCRRRS